jgi:hypothetical protein
MLEQYLEQKEMSNFKFKRKNKYESNAFFIGLNFSTHSKTFTTHSKNFTAHFTFQHIY